jgi:hypothetical protein
MRIVYTNLKEDDAGVKRSVRQFQVDFNGTSARSAVGAPSATPAVAAPDERSHAQMAESAQTPEVAYALDRQEMTPPAEEGIGRFRSIFIKKFVDAQTAVRAGKKGNVSITV